jgi:hypothetical protein
MTCGKPFRATISPHQLQCTSKYCNFHSHSTTHKRRLGGGVKVRNCTLCLSYNSFDPVTAPQFPEIPIDCPAFTTYINLSVLCPSPPADCESQHSLNQRIQDLTTYHQIEHSFPLPLHSSYVGPRSQADGTPYIARGNARGKDCRPSKGRHL